MAGMAGPNDALIERFYGAFARGDGAGMAACYAPAIHFRDPAFGDLDGPAAGAMWRMLAGGARDFRLELLEHDSDATNGTAHWLAHYTFSQTGRPVVNDVRATFRFADGLIVDHVDSFDFHRWAAQALGWRGRLLGGTSFLRSSVQRRARARLEQFVASEGSPSV
jgi:ketosteroid isomerase-like protein